VAWGLGAAGLDDGGAAGLAGDCGADGAAAVPHPARVMMLAAAAAAIAALILVFLLVIIVINPFVSLPIIRPGAASLPAT